MDPQSGGPVSYNSISGTGSGTLIKIILGLLLLVALVFGGWAFSQMQHYKNDSKQITSKAVNSAVAAAQKDQQAKDAEADKQPFKVFQGSPTYGSLSFNYPKTWSAYVDTSNQSEPINGYFYPDIVPGTQSKTAYALRVELVSNDYAQTVQQFQSQISQGAVTARAYLPPKMQGVANVTAGTYLSGQINSQDQTQKGNMLIIKVRDKTLQISTESNNFSADFNDTVLGSLTFNP